MLNYRTGIEDEDDDEKPAPGVFALDGRADLKAIVEQVKIEGSAADPWIAVYEDDERR